MEEANQDWNSFALPAPDAGGDAFGALGGGGGFGDPFGGALPFALPESAMPSISEPSPAGSVHAHKQPGKSRGRRRSAPEMMLDRAAPHHDFKKDYHNRSERERTRRINTSIQELRALIQCPETDKASILATAVVYVSGMVASRKQQAAERTMEISPVFDMMQLAVAMLDLDARVVDCNDTFARFLGRVRDEVAAHELLGLIVPEDTAALSAAMQALVVQVPTPSWNLFSMRFVSKDNAQVLQVACRLSLTVNESNQPAGFGLVFDGLSAQ